MADLKEQLTKIKTHVDQCETHINKLTGGTKASASKARACLMQVKKGSHDLRGSIMEHLKTIPTKSRVKSEILSPSAVAVESGNTPEEPTEPEPTEPEEPKREKKTRKPRAKKTV
jgi:hypothetical protein